MELFNYSEPFELETGTILPGVTIAYHTYGTLNNDKSNVIWICHALTANSDAAAWWPGVVGKNARLSDGQGFADPSKYFIVCANILGSCYGSTGPLTIDPSTDQPYFSNFPMITIRDMVKAHILLRKHLNIEKIHLLMGGSMGGYQVLEWCAMENDVAKNLLLIGTSATESAWGIAVHTAQRLAIEADATWQSHHRNAGAKGLKAARAMGVISYRNYRILVEKQTEPDPEKLDNYKASSYINYQGDKLVSRFNAYSYWLLTKSMDSHHLGRGRGGNAIPVLQNIKQRTLIIGIDSDILCPLHEQELLAENIANSTLITIDSPYGHDGFITEAAKISKALGEWL
ncbi:MAG: homoserine O-acetyltransferase [Chitinophagales bacterium]